MKKYILMVSIMAMSLLVGCGAAESQESTNQTTKPINVETTPAEEISQPQESDNDTNENVTEKEEAEEAPSTPGSLYDTIFDENSAEIIADKINDIVESSNSLQEEIRKVEELSAEYIALLEEHDSQTDMNMISYRSEMVWDTELNNLWSRMSNDLDATTKEKTLSDLRVWNANKESIIIDTIGKAEDGGSIYSLLYNDLMESMVRKKVHELAEVYANYLGETYEKPDLSALGTYVDHQGTTDIYSSLMIRCSLAGEMEAIINIHRLATLTGAVTQEGNILHYTDSDSNLTGTITYGWDGATFTVEASDYGSIQAGDIFTFDTVY